MAEIVAILLAAGESRRMGRLKALLSWAGTTLIRHQVAALREGGADRVVVVLGHQAPALEQELRGLAGVETVLNPDYRQGKTTSIKTGLGKIGSSEVGTGQNGLSVVDAAHTEAILLLNVDQPRSADTIRYLLRQHCASDALITIPTYQDKGGHPIIFSSLLLGELRQIDEATEGIRAVVRRHQEATQRVPVENPEVLWDLNTPEQYAAALEG